jgi:hypothetical protein
LRTTYTRKPRRNSAAPRTKIVRIQKEEINA